MNTDYVFGLNAFELFTFVGVLASLVGVVYLIARGGKQNITEAESRLIEMLQEEQLRKASQDVFNRQALTIQQFVELMEQFVKVVGMANLPHIDNVVDNAADFLEKVTEDFGKEKESKG